jgi:hypothetical protein
VEIDEGPATRAAQEHAEDMARNGYLGHWGADGSVPEQRYTDAGGTHMVLENASGFVDEKTRTLDPHPLIDASEVARAEHQFFDEVPPNDGHRKNILQPTHNKVGIGVAQPLGTDKEIAVPCFTQEFLDAYGTYAPIPRKAKLGSLVRVEGEVSGLATVSGVGVARADAPRPLPVAELNRRRSYSVRARDGVGRRRRARRRSAPAPGRGAQSPPKLQRPHALPDVLAAGLQDADPAAHHGKKILDRRPSQ